MCGDDGPAANVVARDVEIETVTAYVQKKAVASEHVHAEDAIEVTVTLEGGKGDDQHRQSRDDETARAQVVDDSATDVEGAGRRDRTCTADFRDGDRARHVRSDHRLRGPGI